MVSYANITKSKSLEEVVEVYKSNVNNILRDYNNVDKNITFGFVMTFSEYIIDTCNKLINNIKTKKITRDNKIVKDTLETFNFALKNILPKDSKYCIYSTNKLAKNNLGRVFIFLYLMYDKNLMLQYNQKANKYETTKSQLKELLNNFDNIDFNLLALTNDYHDFCKKFTNNTSNIKDLKNLISDLVNYEPSKIRDRRPYTYMKLCMILDKYLNNHSSSINSFNIKSKQLYKMTYYNTKTKKVSHINITFLRILTNINKYYNKYIGNIMSNIENSQNLSELLNVSYVVKNFFTKGSYISELLNNKGEKLVNSMLKNSKQTIDSLNLLHKSKIKNHANLKKTLQKIFNAHNRQIKMNNNVVQNLINVSMSNNNINKIINNNCKIISTNTINSIYKYYMTINGSLPSDIKTKLQKLKGKFYSIKPTKNYKKKDLSKSELSSIVKSIEKPFSYSNALRKKSTLKINKSKLKNNSSKLKSNTKKESFDNKFPDPTKPMPIYV